MAKAKRKGSKGSRNGLKPADIEKFRQLLLVKRSEILGNVSIIEDETFKKERSELSSMPFHMADAGSDNFEQEFALDLMDSEKKLLVEINEALGRIEQGVYGVCEGKGENIPKARLNAIPWARYCVACAELKEKGQLVVEETEEVGGIPDYEAGGDDKSDDDEEEEEEAGDESEEESDSEE
jgi:DnaK suppressor protein